MTGLRRIVTVLDKAAVMPIAQEQASPYMVSGKMEPITGIAEKLTPSRSRMQVA